MADNVVSLRGEPIYQGSPDPDVITEIERLLELAKSGEVIGVAVAMNYRDKATGCRWGGSISIGLAGQCFALANRIIRQLNGWDI